MEGLIPGTSQFYRRRFESSVMGNHMMMPPPQNAAQASWISVWPPYARADVMPPRPTTSPPQPPPLPPPSGAT